MKTVKLKQKEERRILRGHPWVFSNELDRSPVEFAPGEIVDVLDSMGRFLGRGYINPHSLIAVRLLTRIQEEINAGFFRRRIAVARSLRSSLGFGDSFRAVFSEGDNLPGLIVDKYADTLVVQSSTAGIDGMLNEILDALREEYAPEAIILRNDTASRELEGLARETRVVHGAISGPVTFEESGIKYRVDVLEGQKTGFFFDQRENRLALKGYVQGRRTLDCFCYVGAWALSAARFGATEVIGLDSSEKAIALATENAALNGLSVQFKKADVFDELRVLEKQRERFGCIVLDPPAFVKSRAKVREGLKGYKEINLRAMKLLRPEGILITSSCSHHFSDVAFDAVLADAANDASVTAQVLYRTGAAPDHAVLAGFPESHYLKCRIIKITV